ncbi:MAG TPA: COX15/CtaA family protein [Micromonosporaceae bacterium]|nr:COX15/CtaA family protein [Micromonosporaceae bacterium]
MLRRLALASLLANVGIVVTGGAVRLTGSGLGCPTWPRCTDESYVVTPEMGGHGLIEFGNRLLTGVVGLLAVACVVAALLARPRRRPLVGLSLLVFAGIPAQAALGGVTVLTGLNPWVVAAHFLLSMAVVAAAYALWRRAGEPDGPVRAVVGRPVRQLVGVVVAVSAGVLVLGTVVTGSGPHAGDAAAPRTGLDPQTVSQLHADAVFLLLGVSIALWFALRAVGAPAPAVRASAVLVGVELAQGAVGFVQYATGLPALVVAAHMAGACAVWLATLAVAARTHTRVPAGQATGGAAPTGDNPPTSGDSRAPQPVSGLARAGRRS